MPVDFSGKINNISLDATSSHTEDKLSLERTSDGFKFTLYSVDIYARQRGGTTVSIFLNHKDLKEFICLTNKLLSEE